MDSFSQATIEKIDSYVYCLYDPRDAKIFYIGKGTRNRVFDHVKGAVDGDEEDMKVNTIRDIVNTGNRVGHYIVKHGLTAKEALEVESSLIDLLTFPVFQELSKITNIAAGYHSWDRGIRTVDEIESLYAAKPIGDKQISHRVLIININKTYKSGIPPYEATRKYWRLDIKRARNVEFIICEYRGIFRAIYKAKEWLRDDGSKRWYFTGEEVRDRPIIELYLNRLYIEKKKGQVNPIRYVNC